MSAVTTSCERFLRDEDTVSLPEQVLFELPEELKPQAEKLGQLTLTAFHTTPRAEPFYEGVNVVGEKRVPNGIFKLWIKPPVDKDYYHLHKSVVLSPEIDKIAQNLLSASSELTNLQLSESVIQIYPTRATMMRHHDSGIKTANCNLLGSAATTFWLPGTDENEERVVKKDSAQGEIIVIDGEIDHSVTNTTGDYRVVLSMLQS